MEICIKSIHDKPEVSDGLRIYIDRSWPEWLTGDEADVSLWLKELAPSEGTYLWYAGKPERWDNFRDDYFIELEGKLEQISEVVRESDKGKVTLLYHDGAPSRNIATLLMEYIAKNEERILTPMA